MQRNRTINTKHNSKSHYCKYQHKRRFPDKKSALATIQHFAAKRALNTIKQSHTIPVRAYFCPHCNGFHLTSQQDQTKPINTQT